MKSSTSFILLLLTLLAFSAVTHAASGKEKPGKCPVPKLGTFAFCGPWCKSDAECPGSKKCCHWVNCQTCLAPEEG
nr:WAP four-disulfide core domain protein 18-like [Anolis sagrei ordinatus]